MCNICTLFLIDLCYIQGVINFAVNNKSLLKSKVITGEEVLDYEA